MTMVDLTLQRASATAQTLSEPPAAYDICYVDGSGRLLASHSVPCASDKKACILAHAMRPQGTRRIEVWKGASLIYERPQTKRAAAFETLRPSSEPGLAPLAAWRTLPEH
jgi:hypothetical protein